MYDERLSTGRLGVLLLSVKKCLESPRDKLVVSRNPNHPNKFEN